MQLLSQTRQPCSRTCTAQPRRAAAAAHQPSTGAPCISTRSAVLARPISLKSKSVGTSASLSDRHRIRSKVSQGFEAPSRQHITFAAGPSEIRHRLLLLDPPLAATTGSAGDPPKTNDDSGPRLFSNRAALFRPDPGQFRAEPGLAERGPPF